MRPRLFLAALLALPAIGASPAFAQAAIDVPANAAWKHDGTGTVFHAKMAGLHRTAIKDGSASEIDLSLTYQDDSGTGATEATIYLFRPAGGSPAIWFDRSEKQILLRDLFHNPVAVAAPLTFAPPKARVASGLRRMFVPGSGPFKATGLAVMPMGEWLVAIRLSSTAIDAAALDTMMNGVIAGIGWPDGVTEGVAAEPVAACATPLKFDAKAKLGKADMTDAILGSALLSAAAEQAKQEPESGKPVQWCRDGEARSEWGVYHDVESANSYTMALGDAGVVVNLYPNLPLGDKKPGYTLSLGLLDKTLLYPDFNRLPTPDAAFEAVRTITPISSVAHGGKDITLPAK